MKPLFLASLWLFFVSTFVLAQDATVTGHVYLEGQSDHSGVRVGFVRTAPTASSDSAFTDASGLFTKTIPQGVYTISYAKDGYLPQTVTNRSIYADQSLGDVTLETDGLSGNLKGVLASGTYKVSGNVTVASTDTLVLMPGVKLQFKAGVGLAVNGCLEGVGTAVDSIVFASQDTAQRWGGT